jgi:RNA polymerase sigma factor (TIGR02999 family)
MTTGADGADARSGEVTTLLAAARDGDAAAGDRLFSLLYGDLRELAARHVRAAQAPQGHSATSIVHELFLRLARRGELAFHDRVHFFAVASRAMRQIVIDDVRARRRAKRGGGRAGDQLDEALSGVPAAAQEVEALLALDGALHRLGADQPALAETVEWHYFGGLTFGEIAAARGISERTVMRHWRAARAFLHSELESA